jgi:hypothetical protein
MAVVEVVLDGGAFLAVDQTASEGGVLHRLRGDEIHDRVMHDAQQWAGLWFDFLQRDPHLVGVEDGTHLHAETQFHPGLGVDAGSVHLLEGVGFRDDGLGIGFGQRHQPGRLFRPDVGFLRAHEQPVVGVDDVGGRQRWGCLHAGSAGHLGIRGGKHLGHCGNHQTAPSAKIRGVGLRPTPLHADL